MKIDLENRIALVADANQALGKAICAQLTESGARVVCLVNDKAAFEQVSKHFSQLNIKLKVYLADITDFESSSNIIEKIESEIGNIDIVVNNSEHITDIEFNKMSQQQWASNITVNLDSAFNLCRLISERMGERGFGRIINISSLYGRKGSAGKSAYAASKSALHGFTMALAQEVARKGVTVNTVSPGHIEMEEIRELPAADVNSLLAEIPAARLGDAKEVASLVDYLCSPQAGFITGTDIAINGGQYIH